MAEAKTPKRFILKDDTPGSQAKYNMSLDIRQSKPVLIVDIETVAEEVYHDAMRERVLFPEAVMRLRFSQSEAMRFATILVEGVSKHLEAVRNELYRSAVLDDSIEMDEGRFNVSLRAHSAKVNHAGRQKNSARLIMIITRKEDGEEMIVLRLKRNRIVWLLQTLRELYLSYVPKMSIPVGDIDGGRQLMVRNGEFVAIANIWLHGRELQKFQDYIERVVFDFAYNTGDGREFFRYRQVRAGFSEIENVAKVTLTKFNSDHTVYKDASGNKDEMSFLVTSAVVARLFLLLPIFYAKRKEVEVANARSEQIDTTQIEHSEVVLISDTKEITDAERDGDYLLNMIETQIALRVARGKEFNVKTNSGRISLFARYRDGILHDERYGLSRTAKGGEKEDAKLLPQAQIDLGLHWLNIFAIIAESIHNKKGEGTDSYGRIVRRWKFSNRSIFGDEELYIAKTVFSEDNKAVAFIIDKYIERLDELTGLQESSHEGRIRIPFFREHVRTLMKGMVRIAQLFESYYFTRVIDVFDSDAERFSKRTFGIRRSILKKLGEEPREQVFLGSVVAGEQFNGIVLCDEDRDHLKKSAYYRLLYGRWLPFVGEEISMSFEGYLSDLEYEYALEFDRESTQGAGGSVAALAILFASISNLNPETDTASLLDIEEVIIGGEAA